MKKTGQNEQSPNLASYVACMEEIKARYKIIGSFVNRENHALFDVPTIEIIALQYRMIFELIALASLAAHKEVFDEKRKQFSSMWKPNDILRELAKLNPQFYPQPIVVEKSEQPEGGDNFANMKEGFLTPEELIKFHGICGNLLHARNPFGKPLDHHYYNREMSQWAKKIISLLSKHVIKLLDEDVFYYVLLHSVPDGKIATHTFQRVDA